jgi:molybdopterin synthase catalytic subunit
LLAGWIALNEQIFQACKELIDDAKTSCANLVFKEVCLEILSRARQVLPERQFRQLVAYAAERMKEKVPFESQGQENSDTWLGHKSQESKHNLTS